MGFTTARRTWDVERNGRICHVEMEDEYFFGRRVVRVDGNIVHSGRTVLSDHSGAYQFDLAGQPAFLKISTNGFRYYYDLVTEPPPNTAPRDGPPKELVQEPPSLMGVAGSVAWGLAMAAALVLIADGRLWREPVLAAAGVPIDAAVMRAVTTTRDAHRIEYRFQVGARSYTHEAFISKEGYERARSLGIVSVRYLAIAPDINAFPSEPSDLLVDAVFVLVLAVGAGWSLVSAARDFGAYRVWKRLSTTGVDADGRVTRVATLRNLYMYAVGFALEYEYVVLAAGEFRGHSGAFALDAATHYPIGSTVRIRYDPNRPGDSILLAPSA